MNQIQSVVAWLSGEWPTDETLACLHSVVWSALRTGSNTDAFLGGLGGDPYEQPLLERSTPGEENLTSAGLDGDAPKVQTGEPTLLSVGDLITPWTWSWWHHTCYRGVLLIREHTLRSAEKR